MEFPLELPKLSQSNLLTSIKFGAGLLILKHLAAKSNISNFKIPSYNLEPWKQSLTQIVEEFISVPISFSIPLPFLLLFHHLFFFHQLSNLFILLSLSIITFFFLKKDWKKIAIRKDWKKIAIGSFTFLHFTVPFIKHLASFTSTYLRHPCYIFII